MASRSWTVRQLSGSRFQVLCKHHSTLVEEDLGTTLSGATMLDVLDWLMSELPPDLRLQPEEQLFFTTAKEDYVDENHDNRDRHLHGGTSPTETRVEVPAFDA